MSRILAPIWVYLQQMWASRYFCYSLFQLDLTRRYRRSFLGIAWSMLHPIGMTIVFCAVFNSLFQLDLRIYAPFVFTGVLLWNFISNSVLEGCQCIFTAEKYIQAHPAPLAIYPLRTALGMIFHLLVVLSITLVVSWIGLGFNNIVALISLIPTLLLLLVFGWSVAVLFGLLNVYFTDIQHLAQIGLQLLFYLTPVFYPPELIANRGTLTKILAYNPLRFFMDLVREPILYGRFPSLLCYSCALGMTLLLFLIAVGVVIRNERRVVFAL